jgi:hypothetical protein
VRRFALESLSGTLTGNPREPESTRPHYSCTLPLKASRRVVVGSRRNRQGTRTTIMAAAMRQDQEVAGAFQMVDGPVDDVSIQDLVSVGGILTDSKFNETLISRIGHINSMVSMARPLTQTMPIRRRNLINTRKTHLTSLFNGLLLDLTVELLCPLHAVGRSPKLDAQGYLEGARPGSSSRRMFPRFPLVRQRVPGR